MPPRLTVAAAVGAAALALSACSGHGGSVLPSTSGGPSGPGGDPLSGEIAPVRTPASAKTSNGCTTISGGSFAGLTAGVIYTKPVSHQKIGGSCEIGIFVPDGTDGARIEHSEIAAQSVGIAISAGTNAAIDHNTVTVNGSGDVYGVWLSSTSAKLEHNTVTYGTTTPGANAIGYEFFLNGSAVESDHDIAIGTSDPAQVQSVGFFSLLVTLRQSHDEAYGNAIGFDTFAQTQDGQPFTCADYAKAHDVAPESGKKKDHRADLVPFEILDVPCP